MGPPLIGITTSEVRRGAGAQRTPQGEPNRPEMTLGLRYLEAVEAAGGIPVVLPPLEEGAIEPLVGHLAGICLSGGPDLDPQNYGEEGVPELGPIEPEIDRFELEIARLAWSYGLPILAICRGAQTLNVARGGNLIQHIPGHRQKEPGDVATHSVDISPGSRLAALMGSDHPEVNSFHHQAVKRLGDGLRVVAGSPDGVVEAVEAPGRGFVVGVQWHAECLAGRPDNAALFRGLVTAAGGYAGSKLGIRAA